MAKADIEKPPLFNEPWRSPLEELERTLSEVGRAIRGLRNALEGGGDGEPVGPSIHVADIEETDTQAGESDTPNKVFSAGEPAKGAAAVGDAKSPIASFQHVWERLQREGHAGPAGPAETETETRAGESDTSEAETPTGESDTTNEVSSAGEPTEGATFLGGAKSRISNFQHVWDRLQREGDERSAAPEEEVVEVRGLSALPSEYRMTIEDRDGTPVDLLPVQRALRAFASAEDVSLLNFANGTAVISMRTTRELDLDKLAAAIGLATSRECEVIPQDQGKLFLRLSIEEGHPKGS